MAYDASGVGPEPEPYRMRYIDDWINAFYDAIQRNALSDNGVGVDPLANAQLGDILQTLADNA